MSRKKRLIALALTILAGILVISAFGFSKARGGSPSTTPQGFDKYLVYMGAGRYDPSVPPAEGDLAKWFHEEIMGRTPEEIEAEMTAAKVYLEQQFGPGLPDPMPFGLDPRNEYRAYTVSGEWVRPEGWVVRDGGFMVMIGPGGQTLHGEWGGPDGKLVPEGTIMVYGDYNIKREGPGRSHRQLEPIIIHYQSASPIIPHPYEEGIKFECILLSDDFGEGRAQGISIPQTVDGKLQANIRNVLTFPPYGPSIEH